MTINADVAELEILVAMEHLLKAYAALHSEISAIEVRATTDAPHETCLLSFTTPNPKS